MFPPDVYLPWEGKRSFGTIPTPAILYPLRKIVSRVANEFSPGNSHIQDKLMET